MTEENTGQVTQLLQAAADGDRAALGRIYAVLHPALKAMMTDRREVRLGLAFGS